MSKHAIETIREKYAAINRQDVDAILSDVHDDGVVIDPSRPDPTSPDGAWHGKEGFLRFLLDWAESFEDMRYEPVELFAEDGSVIAEVLVRGSGRDSGILVENRRFHVVSFRGDKVARFEICTGRDEAVSAAQEAAAADG